MPSKKNLSPSEILALYAVAAPSMAKDAPPVDFNPQTGRGEETTAYVQSLVDSTCDLLAAGTTGPTVVLDKGLRGTTGWSLVRYTERAWTSTKSGRKYGASVKIGQEILDDPNELARAVLYAAIFHVGLIAGMKVSSDRARRLNENAILLAQPLGLEFHNAKQGDTVHNIHGQIPKSMTPMVKLLSIRTLNTRGCRPVTGNGKDQTAKQFLQTIRDARAASRKAGQKRATATCSNGTELGKLELSSVKGGYFAAACTCGCGEGFAAAENDKGTIIAVPTPLTEIMAARTAAAA